MYGEGQKECEERRARGREGVGRGKETKEPVASVRGNHRREVGSVYAGETRSRRSWGSPRRVVREKAHGEDHEGAAGRAAVLARSGRRERGDMGWRGGEREESPCEREEGGAELRGEEAVVSDLDEAFREDVEEEAVDEDEGREGGSGPRQGGAIFDAEGDLVIVDVEDTVVGDGDAEDVGSEVREHFMTGTGGCAVDDPFEATGPDPGMDEVEEAEGSEFGLETEFDAGGKGLVREEPVVVAVGNPAIVARGEGAGGDDEMDMDMVAQVSAPGLEDADDTGGTAEVLGITGEGEESVSGGAEEGGVDGFLMGARDRAAFVGEGEGDEEVV